MRAADPSVDQGTRDAATDIAYDSDSASSIDASEAGLVDADLASLTQRMRQVPTPQTRMVATRTRVENTNVFVRVPAPRVRKATTFRERLAKVRAAKLLRATQNRSRTSRDMCVESTDTWRRLTATTPGAGPVVYDAAPERLS